MIFERLRLSGFKSFAEPVELPILPGLTGVVGPNGCGKSNLMEGLRWAMGEASARSLRGEGMDDVIFSGARGRPGRAFAEAVLGLVIDSKQAEISRRIDKGEGSTYRMNGRDVRLRDLQLLFADAATGAHAAALVGQGRVSAIIGAKPVERRLMLEEAAGVAGLSVRRREAEIRLRATAANLERVDDLIREIASQVEALQRQAKTAERYAALSARIRLGEAQLLYAEWVSAAARARSAADAARTAEAAAAERRAELEALDLRASEAAKAAAALAEEIRDLDRARDALAGRAARLSDEEARAAARRLELEDALAIAKRDCAREAATAAEAAATLDRLAAESLELDAGHDARRAALDAADAARAQALERVRAGEGELARALEDRAVARAEASAARSALEAAQTRAARLAAELDRLQRERAALAPARLDDSAQTAAIEAARAAVEQALAASEDAARAHAAAQSACASARADLEAVEAVRRTIRSEADALRPAIRAASGALAAVTAAPGYEAALAAALGQDLAAGVGKPGAGWARVTSGAADASLPEGAEPLAAHVRAPPEMARRLDQIGVVADADAAAALAPLLGPGQRLVTRAGGLWRWDGFEALDCADMGAAQRLVAANRLARLEEEEVTLAERKAECAARLAAAEAELRAAAERVRSARAASDAAERAQKDLAATAERLRAEHARQQARAAALDASLERLREELDSAAATHEAAARRAAEAPDPAVAERAVAAAEAAAAAARAAADEAYGHARSARTAAEDADRRIAAIAREADGLKLRKQDAEARGGELAARAEAVAVELSALSDVPRRIAAERLALEADRAALAERADAVAERQAEAERARTASETARAAAAEALAEAREARAAAEVDAEHARTAAGQLGRQALERFSAAPERLPERLGFAPADDPQPVAAALEANRAARDRLGAVNLRAATELDEASARLTGLETERAEIETAVNRLRGQIGALNRDGRERLLATFEAVNRRFGELFARLFGGGDAHLRLIDDEDPLLAGLEIFAKPPGKATRTLGLLSGGEQALTAIALIFAFFLANPSPICVLDEVDAPLDDANTERFCDLIRSVSADAPTRFLIVTHNPLTMARMDRLFGVTMAEPGISQLVSVDLAQAEAFATAAE